MPKDIKKAAAAFVKDWTGRGYEKGDAQIFWSDLLREVVGILDVRNKCKFEYRTASGGFIDCLIPDGSVLIEQKALSVNLDKPELRQGREVTPFEQARAYAESFPANQQPRFIVVCNFETFRVYDRNSCSRIELASKYTEFSLGDLASNPHLLSFMVDPLNSRSEKEKEVSIKAGELIGKLYGALKNQFIDPDSEASLHHLNVLCVRIVFCLFAEDADLFPKDAFLKYLRNADPADMRDLLKKLFRALDTPVEHRDPYDEKIKPFPYVNGGLFSEETEVPNFTPDIKHLLLFEVSQQTDWSSINPTIFGGIFESTLNPETRRSGGMHYTSPDNIHKVIDPLFLDELYLEFDAIRFDQSNTPKKIKANLHKFHRKISSLSFFDPACGSGNFLTETYLCLRKLEDDLLNVLNDGQVSISYEEDNSVQRITLDQFYGIEINNFAVTVAKTALWIAKLQANIQSEMLRNATVEDFPLTDSANVVQENALCIDWNEVLSADECDFIVGNPPFLGARNQSVRQKAEIAEIFNQAKHCGNIDYVAGWYMKAAKYIKRATSVAFVSTNSICQGEQVASIWKPLYELGIRINFACTTFRWSNEAAGQAHVYCVIVGFSKTEKPKRLFVCTTPDSQPIETHPSSINAYLCDAPDVFIWNRSKPICSVPRMGIGNKPIDGGYYLFKKEEMDSFLKSEPAAEKYFHPWVGAEEFLNNKQRWVLWLGEVSPADLKKLPLCMERIRAVQQYRLNSKSAPTQKLANTPTRFHVENMPLGNSIIVPQVSSERRHYIPMGFIGSETICSNLVSLIPDAALYHFGILQSHLHNVWMRRVCGRLKSDYRYSAGIVYNNFVWPSPSNEEIRLIEEKAQAILDARAFYPESSLADLYDPNNSFLFNELFRAHEELDRAVEKAYGINFNRDEGKIVAHLFKLYEKEQQE